MPTPLVTIGLPLVNEPIEDIEFAIKSIYAQSFTNWELIIFCDGSSDSHGDRLKEISDPRVTLVRNPTPTGIGRNLNRLASMARGEYIAILAADDAWPTNRLEIQLKHLTMPTAPDVSAGQMLIISDSETIQGGQPLAEIPNRESGWVSGTPISHATAMARTRWFQDHPYDESLLRAQDRAFWIIAHRGSSIEILDDILYYYRVPTLPNFKKYTRSCKFARRVIWNYGPRICSRGSVISIYLESFVKQTIVSLAYATGQFDKVYQRRLLELDHGVRGFHERQLGIISDTQVPGWPHSNDA